MLFWKKIFDLVAPVQPEEMNMLKIKKPKRKLIRKPKNRIEKIEWGCLTVIALVFLMYIITLISLEILIIF